MPTRGSAHHALSVPVGEMRRSAADVQCQAPQARRSAHGQVWLDPGTCSRLPPEPGPCGRRQWRPRIAAQPSQVALLVTALRAGLSSSQAIAIGTLIEINASADASDTGLTMGRTADGLDIDAPPCGSRRGNASFSSLAVISPPPAGPRPQPDELLTPALRSPAQRARASARRGVSAHRSDRTSVRKSPKGPSLPLRSSSRDRLAAKIRRVSGEFRAISPSTCRPGPSASFSLMTARSNSPLPQKIFAMLAAARSLDTELLRERAGNRFQQSGIPICNENPHDADYAPASSQI